MGQPSMAWETLGRHNIYEDDFANGKCTICKEEGVTNVTLTFNFMKPLEELSKKDQRFFIEYARSKGEPEPKGVEIPLDQNLSGQMCANCIAQCLSAVSLTLSIINLESYITNTVKTFR